MKVIMMLDWPFVPVLVSSKVRVGKSKNLIVIVIGMETCSSRKRNGETQEEMVEPLSEWRVF